MTDKAIAFKKELKELMEKYPEATFGVSQCPYYGNVEGVEVYLHKTRIAYTDDWGEGPLHFEK